MHCRKPFVIILFRKLHSMAEEYYSSGLYVCNSNRKFYSMNISHSVDALDAYESTR